MTETFQKSVYPAPVDHNHVRDDWRSRGFSFGVFRDPPGQEWNDFVHDTNEYVVVAEGELVISVGDEWSRCSAGDQVWIPKGVRHSLKTLSGDGSVWLYGYGDGHGG
ncbi:MAG: cupin domain-containing protein [Rhizobiaceae bacterium]